jgi:hypothetical protein
MSTDVSARIREAEQVLPLPRLWKVLGLPGEPSKQCRSPFRDDNKPSFSVFGGVDGRWRWKDLGTGDYGDAVDFLRIARGYDNRTAIAKYLELSGFEDPRLAVSQGHQKEEKAKPVQAEQYPDVSKLRKAIPNELIQAAKSRRLDVAAFRHAHDELGTLRVQDGFYGHPSWVLYDASGRIAEGRRLDGKPFERAEGTFKLMTFGKSQKTWPVGLLPLHGVQPSVLIALVEGMPDYFAALHFALRQGVSIHPVAMLGRGLTISTKALQYFRNRRVRIYPHNDPDGHGEKAGEFWRKQLTEAGAETDLFSFRDLRKTNGDPVKDFNELIDLKLNQTKQLTKLFSKLPINNK